MEFYHHLHHLLVIPFVVLFGYLAFMSSFLDFNWMSKISVIHSAPCQNRCDVILLNSSSAADKFDSFSLDISQALLVHFHWNNSVLRIETPKDPQVILDPVNLVWVEDITAPFLSLDLGFNVYSLTTLKKKVHNMSVMVDFDSLKFLKNISYSCVTASLASAFLTNVSQQRGVLCYVVNNSLSDVPVKYKCCKKTFQTEQIECDIPASINPHMSGVFNIIVVVSTIFFLCFPSVFIVSFPDENDSSQILSANVQVRNPLYRIANFAVQKLWHYSAKYYFANVIRKLFIGFSLPMLFYIDLGLTLYTAKYDIPKMFNDAVRKRWKEEKLSMVVFAIVSYSILVLIFSLLPRTENLNFSLAPAKVRDEHQEYVHYLYSCQKKDFDLDWTKPCSLTGKMFKKLCFVCRDSIFLRIYSCLVSSFLIMIVFPIIAVLIFIGYGWYVSPFSRKMSHLFCHISIYFLWLSWHFGEAERCLGVVLGGFVVVANISFGIILFRSLILISRLITYLCMGIVASKNYYLPLIALFSLFVFYIWNCFSSVGMAYKELLNQTFDKCKEYNKNNRKIILVNNKGLPKIPQLSDIFQKVVDEIMPFSKAYTVMCVRISIIGSFLLLTYYSILVYGKTTLNDLTKTLAVSLAGLIPKFVEIFHSDSSKDLIDKETEYRINKIIHDFWDFGNAHAVREVGIQTEMNPLDDNRQQGNPGETSVDSENRNSNICTSRSTSFRGSERESQGSCQLVHVDSNPTSINCDPSNEMTPLLHSHSGPMFDNSI